MKPRRSALLALAVATVAGLGSQVLSYGLVYPAKAQHSRLPVLFGLLSGGVATTCAIALALLALRYSALKSERFVARLSLLVGVFFLLVVIAGFGIPVLFLEPKD